MNVKLKFHTKMIMFPKGPEIIHRLISFQFLHYSFCQKIMQNSIRYLLGVLIFTFMTRVYTSDTYHTRPIRQIPAHLGTTGIANPCTCMFWKVRGDSVDMHNNI